MILPTDRSAAVDITGKYLSFETQGRRPSRTCWQAHGRGGGVHRALKHLTFLKKTKNWDDWIPTKSAEVVTLVNLQLFCQPKRVNFLHCSSCSKLWFRANKRYLFLYQGCTGWHQLWAHIISLLDWGLHWLYAQLSKNMKTMRGHLLKIPLYCSETIEALCLVKM